MLHLALGVVSYYAFQPQGLIVLLAEVVLLFSAYVAFRIHRSIIAPVQLLARGAAALEDQDFSVKLLPTGSREMDRVANIYNRMIDQLRNERVAGVQREEFLDRLINAAELGVAILDFDGRVESMNAWLAAKCEQETFRTQVLNAALASPPTSTYELAPNEAHRQDVLIGPDNRRYRVETANFIDRGFERGFLIVQDVTAELFAAEKEAYGKVIRMMAHEVNNSNAAIVSVLRSLLEVASEEEAALTALSKDYLPAIINRAENMTSFMRNFARVIRLPAADLKKTDLNALLRRTGEVMQPVLREANISLEFALSPEPLWIQADAAQLEQVVINAVTNARESIGQKGAIRISSASFPASLVIADNGPGIVAAAQGQLFKPFFSTKPSGQGVGLTLSRDILEAHRATYQLATEADGWTRLRISF